MATLTCACNRSIALASARKPLWLRLQLIVEGFHFGQGGAFLFIFLAADAGRAFSIHVLEHVRDAVGGPWGRPPRPHFDVLVEGGYGGRVALENDECMPLASVNSVIFFRNPPGSCRQTAGTNSCASLKRGCCHEISSLSLGLDVQSPF
jgi:hypothetical protein